MEESSFLLQAAVFLAAAAIAAPIANRLLVGSVLGYMLAGVLIGPYGLGFIYWKYQVKGILHIAELGIVLLLFLIGLELKPKRLWTLRRGIIGAGGAQVAITSAALVACGIILGLSASKALIVGLALSLSSTAFVIQVLEERGELAQKHGRLAFSILLFQDLAAIPIIALIPMFAVGGDAGQSMSVIGGLRALGVIVLVVVTGRFALRHLYRLVAASGVREAMTASALLTVVGVSLLMEMAGLSAALGAFIAGALLADTEYRHQIEADIAPFKGLLLGLFFTAIGMSLNLELLSLDWIRVMQLVAGLLIIKGIVLYGVGRYHGLDNRGARRLGLGASQGGEFAFVIFTAATAVSALDRPLVELLLLAVTITMVATPLLLLLDDWLLPPKDKAGADFDAPPDEEDHVVIAGFGRFGQIIARVLVAKHIKFTALDNNAAQVDFVRSFGSKIYYGDPQRLDILEAAKTRKAQAFILAIDDQEASIKVAKIVRQHFPNITIYARARNREHVHQLMDLGIEHIHRETFLSALEVTRDVMKGLGYSDEQTNTMVDTFADHDEQRLFDDYEHRSDAEKIKASALQQAEDLEQLFARDAEFRQKIEDESGS